MDTTGEGPRIAVVKTGIIAEVPAAGHHHDRQSTTSRRARTSWDTEGWPG